MIAERAPGAGAARAPRWPAKLIIVDAERCPLEISAARAEGGKYNAIWVLARIGGEPRALLEVPCPGEHLTAAQLEQLFAELPPVPPRATAVPDRWPRFTVVISTIFERTDELRRTLAAMAAVDYPNMELLLVDNRRTEGPLPAWLAGTPGLRLLAERQPGLASGRNRGLAEATGEYVVFTDDDVVPDPGWLKAFAARFAANPHEVGIAGLVLPNGLETQANLRIEEYYGGYGTRVLRPLSYTLQPRSWWRLFTPATVVGTDDQGVAVQRFSLYEGGKLGVGANLAFRTRAIRALGGFDARLGAGTPARSGEDLAIMARLAWSGHAIGYAPAAFLLHTDRPDDQALQTKLEGYGTGLTAELVSLVLSDPRHLGAMFATVPEGVRRLVSYFNARLRSTDAGGEVGDDRGAAPISSLADLARMELRGMVHGPVAFLQSHRRLRQRR